MQRIVGIQKQVVKQEKKLEGLYHLRNMVVGEFGGLGNEGDDKEGCDNDLSEDEKR